MSSWSAFGLSKRSPGRPRRRPEGPEIVFLRPPGSISGPIFDDFGRFLAIFRATRSGSAPGQMFHRFSIDLLLALEKSDLHFVWENAIRTQGRPLATRRHLQRRKNSQIRPKIDPKHRKFYRISVPEHNPKLRKMSASKLIYLLLIVQF